MVAKQTKGLANSAIFRVSKKNQNMRVILQNYLCLLPQGGKHLRAGRRAEPRHLLLSCCSR
jgi:hypothetical protein